MAVGRDVPIAPPRLSAVRGLAFRAPLLRALAVRTACAPLRAHPSRPVAARPRSRPVVWCRGFAAGGDDQTPRPARL